MRDQARQLVHFHIEKILHLSVRKFIEIKKSERTSLGFRGGRNPDRKLVRIKLCHAGCRLDGDRFLRHLAAFRLPIAF